MITLRPSMGRCHVSMVMGSNLSLNLTPSDMLLEFCIFRPLQRARINITALSTFQHLQTWGTNTCCTCPKSSWLTVKLAELESRVKAFFESAIFVIASVSRDASWLYLCF